MRAVASVPSTWGQDSRSLLLHAIEFSLLQAGSGCKAGQLCRLACALCIAWGTAGHIGCPLVPCRVIDISIVESLVSQEEQSSFTLQPGAPLPNHGY